MTREANGVEVWFWAYGADGRKAGRDYKAQVSRLEGEATTVWRTRHRDREEWHLIACGRVVDLAKLDGRLWGKRCPEPQEGMADACLARHTRVLLESIAKGESHGDKHYGHGKEMDHAGQLWDLPTGEGP